MNYQPCVLYNYFSRHKESHFNFNQELTLRIPQLQPIAITKYDIAKPGYSVGFAKRGGKLLGSKILVLLMVYYSACGVMRTGMGTPVLTTNIPGTWERVDRS